MRKQEAEKEPLRIEAAKLPSTSEQCKPAAAQPNPKKLKRERPSSRFGLVNDSDSEGSDQEVGEALLTPAAESAAADKQADAAKPSPSRDSFTFGGNRSPEEGSHLRNFLKDAQLSPALPKPTFSFAAPAKGSQSRQKGRTGQNLLEELPNGLPNGPAAFPGGKRSSPASFELPSPSKDKPEANLLKVRSYINDSLVSLIAFAA